MKQHLLSPTILALALVLLPAAIWAERTHVDTWHNRLLWPVFEPEVNRHTPVFLAGTELPATITEHYHITAADNPVILKDTIRIAQDASLTIGPGVYVIAHEYASLHIDGRLRADGTEHAPVRFISNEYHPRNRVWSGLLFSASGQGDLTHTVIRHGYPAITCLTGSVVRMSEMDIGLGNVELYTESEYCTL